MSRHLFTVAAAKLVKARLGGLAPLEWWTTELRWPDSTRMQQDACGPLWGGPMGRFDAGKERPKLAVVRSTTEL